MLCCQAISLTENRSIVTGVWINKISTTKQNMKKPERPDEAGTPVQRSI